MKHFFIWCGLLLSFPAITQEQLGLRLENYAGVNSLALNPTGNLHNPLSWDLNIAGAGIFFENNYGFIRQTNTFDLLKNSESAEFLLADEVEGAVPVNTYLIDFFDIDRRRFAAFNGYVEGPSLAVKIGEQHSVGVFTKLRSAGGTHNTPNVFSYDFYDGQGFNDPFDVPPFDGAVMTWTEVGLNYAFQIPTYSGRLGFGVSLKHLTGYEAGYVENFSTWEHTKVPGSTVSVDNLNSRFGFTTSNLTEDGFEQTKNGTGFGVDLGATLTIDEYEDSYKWRFSAAILDIGAINFNQNAEAHRVDTDSIIFLTSDDYDRYQSVEEVDDIIQQFSEQALGTPSASLQSDEFSLTLPTALSLQADYSFTENIFLNATMVQRVAFGGVGPRRGNLFALTPRFEHRWFSASLPVAVYDWQALRVGFAARLGYLVVGSDDLGSLVGKGDYTGTDLYVALKFNPFELGWGLFDGSGGKRRYGGRGKVKCYDF